MARTISCRYAAPAPRCARGLTRGAAAQICIFVVVHAELDNPLLEKDTMWTLCDSASLRGEGGYYLTVFESALHYVRAPRRPSPPRVPPTLLRDLTSSNCAASVAGPNAL